MADVTIDVSEDDDEAVVVTNTHAFNWTMTCSGVTIEMRWEQIGSLYDALREYFEEPAT